MSDYTSHELATAPECAYCSMSGVLMLNPTREHTESHKREGSVTLTRAEVEAIERAAAEKALTDMANELSLMDDGGKRGLAGHSKSSASAITHRHAVAVIRARAEAYRQERGEQ